MNQNKNFAAQLMASVGSFVALPLLFHWFYVAIQNFAGADFMLIGSVKTSVDMVDNKTVRTYFVYAELIDIETNRKLWMGENSEIKKLVTRSAFRG